MRFPLLHLPSLASINVINSIDVKDFINLIRTSTRMGGLVKHSRVHIELTIRGNYFLSFKKLSDPNNTKIVDFFVQSLSIEDQETIPFKPSLRQRSTWMWETESDLEGYRKMMDDFVNFFIVKSVNFDMVMIQPDVSMQYIEHAMKFDLKVKKAQVTLDGEKLEDDRRVMAACAHASELHVSTFRCPESFRIEGLHEYAMDYFELKLDGSFEWFRIDNLCALVNCSKVKISNMKMSDEELNTFLKHWITGAGKMKTLVVHIEFSYHNYDKEPIDSQVVLNGIPRKVIEIDLDEKYEIERSDGVKTHVTFSDLTFILGDPDSI